MRWIASARIDGIGDARSRRSPWRPDRPRRRPRRRSESIWRRSTSRATKRVVERLRAVAGVGQTDLAAAARRARRPRPAPRPRSSAGSTRKRSSRVGRDPPRRRPRRIEDAAADGLREHGPLAARETLDRRLDHVFGADEGRRARLPERRPPSQNWPDARHRLDCCHILGFVCSRAHRAAPRDRGPAPGIGHGRRAHRMPHIVRRHTTAPDRPRSDSRTRPATRLSERLCSAGPSRARPIGAHATPRRESRLGPIYSHSRLVELRELPEAVRVPVRPEDPERDRSRSRPSSASGSTRSSSGSISSSGRGQIPGIEKVVDRYQKLWEETYDAERVRIVREGTPLSFYRELGESCLRGYYLRHYPFDEGETLGHRAARRLPPRRGRPVSDAGHHRSHLPRAGRRDRGPRLQDRRARPLTAHPRRGPPARALPDRSRARVRRGHAVPARLALRREEP